MGRDPGHCTSAPGFSEARANRRFGPAVFRSPFSWYSIFVFFVSLIWFNSFVFLSIVLSIVLSTVKVSVRKLLIQLSFIPVVWSNFRVNIIARADCSQCPTRSFLCLSTLSPSQLPTCPLCSPPGKKTKLPLLSSTCRGRQPQE